MSESCGDAECGDAAPRLLTSGSRGGDQIFAQVALEAGHDVTVYTFKGHFPAVPMHERVQRIQLAAICESDEWCIRLDGVVARAGVRLNRSVSRYEVNQKRLWCQALLACSVDSLYVVGTIDLGTPLYSVHVGGCDRGPKWVVQMCADEMLARAVGQGRPTCGVFLPIYMYNITTVGGEGPAWFRCVAYTMYDDDDEGGGVEGSGDEGGGEGVDITLWRYSWERVLGGAPPTPTGAYGGVGATCVNTKLKVPLVLADLLGRPGDAVMPASAS